MTARLILVVAAYFPDSYGGAERQAQILAEALGRRGVDVTLVAPTTWKDAPEVEPTAFGRIARFKVKAYPNQAGRHALDFIRWTRWFSNRFGTGPDAGVPIYVFHARLHALGPALAARRSGAPLVIKLGGGGEASDFAALRAKRFLYGRWVQDLLLKQTDAFVANGAQIVDDLRGLGVPEDRIAAFPNGVEMPSSQAFEAALARRTGDRFVFAGRMVSDKRVEVLQQAAWSLADADRPPHLTFFGSGPEVARLSGLPGTPAQKRTVTYAGYSPDAAAAMAEFDVFVSASLREGQSNALLEAMAAGTAPMVCPASGAKDLITEAVSGWIVPDSSPEAFAQAMRRALAMSPAERETMARSARAAVERHCGIEAIADRTSSLASRLLEGRS